MFKIFSKSVVENGLRWHLVLSALLLSISFSTAQIVTLGNGSYTTQYPGVDIAGRNGYPSGVPLLIGNAVGKPVPTNDWWSNKVKNAHSDNLFNYPFTLKTVNGGLVHSYIPFGVIDDILPVVVGVDGLNANESRVSDFSDWTVSMNWNDGSHSFSATAGLGMPFTYFEKGGNDIARVIVNQGTVTISGSDLLIQDTRNGADFIVFAPQGSSWLKLGNTYTSTLNNKNYWSLAFVPASMSSNLNQAATALRKHAFVYPTNTKVSWYFDKNSSVVRSEFDVQVTIKEGSDSTVLMGLLPHQWAHLAANSPIPTGSEIKHVRGTIKTLDGNHFAVERTFYGILPTLPYVDFYNPSYSPAMMYEKTSLLRNDQLPTWTDSYNEGQLMNRIIQTARIAEEIGDTATLNRQIATIKERLEDWLTYNSGEKAFLFYYNSDWSALLGYPAGHGQDVNINDHHFHWGYFIHAAAFMEQHEPGWSSKWGQMVNLLIRDAASFNRNDPMFPFLRNFSPYTGHCWANGFATFPQGNDQESTSESMQFNSSLIHWGIITGNDSIRDLGIFLYTTEQSAIEEYWFDQKNRIFQPAQQYGMVSRVWGNSYDNGTFWTNDIAASYGIELYPIHGGSFYLGHDSGYVKSIWDEMTQYTGILSNQANDNLWHDEYWKYLALIDPEEALKLYSSYPDRNLKFGISDAQTYHWMHALNVLGLVDISVTADYPIAMVFKKNGVKTYVAHNYGNSAIQVRFSDGFILDVPARKLVTNVDAQIEGVLSTPFLKAYPGGSVELTLVVSSGTATKVEFFDGEQSLGEVFSAPYSMKASQLSIGRHSIYAKIYDGQKFSISNILQVEVGEQVPYSGSPHVIPGEIQAGHFDVFQGGNGQGIAYNDLSQGNNGDFREEEHVDAQLVPNEGATVGWISNGEWLEYTVEVKQAGRYKLALRYACGNNQGGGPVNLYLDEERIKTNISFTYTGDWGAWSTLNTDNIPLKSGKNVLRIAFEGGEINLGKILFTYDSPLPYSQPLADAGENVLIQLPQTSTQLDGTGSSDPGNNSLTYKWTQIYGPTLLHFSDQSNGSPTISGLEEGVYLIQLEVDNGLHQDRDQLYVISSTSNDIAPSVALITPRNNAVFLAQDSLLFQALASDLVGEIDYVEFYLGANLIGRDTVSPFEIKWFAQVGDYVLRAKAVDDGNLSANSNLVNFKVNLPPLCRDTVPSRDFAYEFSSADNNPTLTFIPLKSGVGNPTCILYYGTSASGLPGYGVKPNIPFQLNASKGERLYFYYTYAHPNGGERNNAADKLSYVVGSCVDEYADINSIEFVERNVDFQVYPNPTRNYVTVKSSSTTFHVRVTDPVGKLILVCDVLGSETKINLSDLSQGIYFIEVQHGIVRETFKVLKH